MFALGCGWGGVSRPRNARHAWFSGMAVGSVMMALVIYNASLPEPANFQEAKDHYTRGALGVAYIFLGPVIAGLLCAWVERSTRTFS